MTGHYFQDWLLLETDWNWRLEPEPRAARCAPSATSAPTGSTSSRSSPASASPRSWPTSPRSSRRASSPTGPVETFSTERAAETVEREIATEDAAHDPAALRERRARHGRHQPAQRRAARTRSSTRSTARPAPSPGTRSSRTSCGSATATTPNEILIRNPALMGAAGQAAAAPAGRPRRGLRGHLPRALPGRLRRRRRGPRRPSDPRTRPSPTATTRCWSATPSPRAPATAAGRRSTAALAPPDQQLEDSVRMKLGFLTAPLPGHAARRTSPTGRARTASRASRSPAGRRRRAPAGGTRAQSTSTSPTCPTAGRREIVAEVASHGPDHLRARLLPEPDPP